jgi:hypothetical protein
MPLFFWLRLILFCLFGLLFVVLPLLILVIAMLEKRGSTQYLPLPPDKLKPWTSSNKAVLAAAKPPVFEPLGIYSANGRGQVAFFISEDYSTILSVGQASIVSDYDFTTSMADGRVVMTSRTGGLKDLSGLELREAMPSKNPEVIYRHHMDRVAALEEPPGIFDPDRFLDQIREHENNKMNRVIELGMGRAAGDGKWVCTFKGAVLSAFSVHMHSKDLQKAAKEAQRKDKAYQAWAKSQKQHS